MFKIGLHAALVCAVGYALTGFTTQVHAQAASPSTIVTFVNGTSAPVTLQKAPNISGTLSPEAPSSIAANQSSGAIISSSAGAADSGIIYYKSCRFNWSTIGLLNSATNTVTWTFSQGASPSSSCSVVVNEADYTTGAHTVTFTIKK